MKKSLASRKYKYWKEDIKKEIVFLKFRLNLGMWLIFLREESRLDANLYSKRNII